ncbi:SDR family oxidoreductase [Metabacillus iocasae]|uniref:Nucleoside-diphosphate-sugar epimerase n=1 Tax=Priestia iocasae TaxID=2291674 RepID=A0ABS2QZY6_9BACI|nr:aldehyde reductase [Metabacillus iocasae]MBM7705044.1 nucleoside-diphosphate-sugar epimerase [Metabacillus iocasae]
MNKVTALVTGGTGYVASWIIKELLEQGHDVRMTVRNKNQTDKYAHLRGIEKEAPGQLFVYEADLLKKGSFDEAVDGSEYVFHTASPFFISGIKDAYSDLVKPAKEGTRNVLESVNKATSVKRVILTSSAVAIFGDNADMKGKAAFTEADWNETSSEKHQPYSYSKTVAEKEAWEMVKEQNRWDLVTINPTFILGPSLAKRTDSTSISTIRDFLTGTYKTGVPHLVNGTVDVRDIAKAQVLAAFTPEASGRYLTSNEEATLLHMANILERNFPGKYKLPKREVPKALIWLIAPTIGFTREYVSKNVGYAAKFDNSKSIRELGMTYRSLEETLVDQTKQLVKDGSI